MKRKDIAVLVVVVIVASFISILLSKFLFAPDSNRNMKAQVVQPVSAEFIKPDERVFNQNAINPTQLIQIGNNSNSKPF